MTSLFRRGGGTGSRCGPRRKFGLWLAFCASACSSPDNASHPGDDPILRDVVSSVSPAVRFEPAEGLQLVPGQRWSVHVRATPAGTHRVRFALLGRPNVPRDASLERSEIVTAPDGTAAVLLTAPTTPTIFTLRATFDAAVAEIPVSVSDSGFAALEVRPHYAGQREVSQWVASVHQGVTCQAMSRDPGSDGSLTVQVPANQAPRIEGIPLGVALAVRVRTGYFAFGCVELGKLSPNASNKVELEVQDVPLKLAGARLNVSLGIEPPEVPWPVSLRPAMDVFLDQLRGGASDDVQALLDAMRAQVEPPLTTGGFDAARTSNAWDSAVRRALGSGAASALRTPVEGWMKQRFASLNSSNALSGVLTVSASPSTGTLELTSVAGLPASEAGFRSMNPVAVSTKAGDTILIGAGQAAASDLRLPWSPSQLLAGLAWLSARAQYPGAANAGAALAEHLSCREVASVLESNGVLFAGCDADCGRALCEDALSALWARARNAAPAVPSASSLSLSAVAAARIDVHARPLAFTGTWLGKLTAASSVASVGGGISGNTANVAELSF